MGKKVLKNGFFIINIGMSIFVTASSLQQKRRDPYAVQVLPWGHKETQTEIKANTELAACKGEPSPVNIVGRASTQGTQTDFICSKPPSATFPNGIWHNWRDLRDIEVLQHQVNNYKMQLNRVLNQGSATLESSSQWQPLRDSTTGDVVPSVRRRPGPQSHCRTANSHIESFANTVDAAELQYLQQHVRNLQQQVDCFKIERARWLRHVPSRSKEIPIDSLDFYTYFNGHCKEVNSLKQQLQETEDLLKKAEERIAKNRSEEQSARDLKKNNQRLTAQVNALNAKVQSLEEKHTLTAQRNQSLEITLFQVLQEKKKWKDAYMKLQQQSA